MRKKLTFKKMSSAWLFVIPALIPLIVFWIYPILRSICISFTDWDYMSPIMGTYMLPTAATYIPSYIILSKLHLLNTFTGLIVSNCVSIFGIFLLRQAFMQVPLGIVEAARIDGASNWKILWQVVCPMTKSSFITFGLMNFITCYNSYMWPSLITDSNEKMMVSQGLRKFFIEGGAYGTEWPLVMAGSALIVLPLLILFAFTQKWFINGIGGDTGMKG